jgi:hypothetical protein
MEDSIEYHEEDEISNFPAPAVSTHARAVTYISM